MTLSVPEILALLTSEAEADHMAALKACSPEHITYANERLTMIRALRAALEFHVEHSRRPGLIASIFGGWRSEARYRAAATQVKKASQLARIISTCKTPEQLETARQMVDGFEAANREELSAAIMPDLLCTLSYIHNLREQVNQNN